MPGPHDSFFKQTFSIKEHAADFAMHVLPEKISEKIDFSTIRLENASYIDEELSEHFSDMVYLCSYKKQSEICISLLFEHKSSPDRHLPHQLNKYMVRIWESNIKQNQPFIPVIPIVLYHGKKRWKPGKLQSCFKNLPEELTAFIPDFSYVFINLSNYSDKEIKETIFTAISLKISLLILKNIFYPETLETELSDFLEIGKSYFQEEKSLKFLEVVIKYIYKATDIKTSKVVEAVASITKKGGELAMTTAEKLRQEGRQQGRQEGVQLGSYNTYFNLIQNMKKNNIPETEIAKLINMEISLVKKIAKKEKIEIPLHLLDSDL